MHETPFWFIFYKIILDNTKNLQKWKHDYSNHLAVIHELLKSQSYDKLFEYVNQQREFLPKIFPAINTGHRIIDAILTSKYIIARSENIAFTYSVVLPKHLPVNDIEITGILGNLLDNSIEACKDMVQTQDTTSPYVHVSLKPLRSMFHIYVKNSSSGNYLYHFDGQLKTNKKEPELHGRGLANTIEIVEKHSGFCNIDARTDQFTVDVYIPLLTER